MPNDYYKLPIPFLHILERNDIPKCDLKTSIAQKIHLTLITFLGESRYNKVYGCIVWENDFENIYNLTAWKDKITRSISDALTENEKRLVNIRVAVEITQEEIADERLSKVKILRKKLDVRVNGKLLKTNEPFYFAEPVYVSPVSLD